MRGLWLTLGFGAAAGVAASAFLLGPVFKQDYETCMVSEMRGQTASMQSIVDKFCTKRAHRRVDLKARGVRATWRGDWIQQVVEADGYELSDGKFVFSGKECAESKDEDFKLFAKGDAGSDGTIGLMAMLDSTADALAPKCMRTLALYGYYR